MIKLKPHQAILQEGGESKIHLDIRKNLLKCDSEVSSTDEETQCASVQLQKESLSIGSDSDKHQNGMNARHEENIAETTKKCCDYRKDTNGPSDSLDTLPMDEPLITLLRRVVAGSVSMGPGQNQPCTKSGDGISTDKTMILDGATVECVQGQAGSSTKQDKYVDNDQVQSSESKDAGSNKISDDMKGFLIKEQILDDGAPCLPLSGSPISRPLVSKLLTKRPRSNVESRMEKRLELNLHASPIPPVKKSYRTRLCIRETGSWKWSRWSWNTVVVKTLIFNQPLEKMSKISCIFLLVLVILLSYSGIFSGHWEWINFDDMENFVENKHIQSLSLENIRWIFADGIVLGVYEPVSNLVKLALWISSSYIAANVANISPALFATSARSFVLLSVTLHVANSVLAFFLAELGIEVSRRFQASEKQKKKRRPQPSEEERRQKIACLGATLMFATHPLRVECCAWASALPYTLSSFFAISAFCVHLKRVINIKVISTSSRENNVSKYASHFFEVLLVAMAVFSKAASISIAGLIVLVDCVIVAFGPPRSRRGCVRNDSCLGVCLNAHSIFQCDRTWASFACASCPLFWRCDRMQKVPSCVI